MGNVVAVTPSSFDARQLALIKRTVAADTTDDELNLFIHTARHLRLDPLRRQVYALVYNKEKPDKRRMSIIVGIDGFRTIADRTGNYRPDEDEPTLEFDPALKGPLNPSGLVKATVRVWKFAHGAWHRVTGVARWEEFAPLSEEWAYDDREGKRRPTGKQTLDPKSNWYRMPCVMLPKVAEAAALRKAWPDDLSNVYEAAEMDRARVSDLLPSEAALEGASAERLERIGAGKTILFQFGVNCPLEPVEIGKLADRIMEHIRDLGDDQNAVRAWEMQNRHGLREFWARASNGDPLAVKKALEAASR